jgi:hypothetical protein
MRHVVAALVSGRALASNRQDAARAPARERSRASVRRRRRTAPLWAWLVTVWKSAYPGA